MKKILFVCKFNRLRSVLAEAYFNKVNTSTDITARSAGLIKGGPISDDILALARHYDLQLKPNPEGLTMEVLEWQNTIIIVANDVPLSILEDPRIKTDQIIVWDIKDRNQSAEEIFKNIDNLLKNINGKK